MGRKTEKHKTTFVKFHQEEMGVQPLSVRVNAQLDKFVRSLPNRTEWLREAIAEKYEREKQAQNQQESA